MSHVCLTLHLLKRYTFRYIDLYTLQCSHVTPSCGLILLWMKTQENSDGQTLHFPPVCVIWDTVQASGYIDDMAWSRDYAQQKWRYSRWAVGRIGRELRHRGIDADTVESTLEWLQTVRFLSMPSPSCMLEWHGAPHPTSTPVSAETYALWDMNYPTWAVLV